MARKGLLMLGQLFEADELMSSEQLQFKHAAHDFSEVFIAESLYVQKHKERDKLCATPPSMEQFFMLTIK